MVTAILMVVVLGLAGLRNAQVYRIRMNVLYDPDYTTSESNNNIDMLPSYDYMFAHPTQWYMWTASQYKRRYVLNNNG